MNEDYKTYQCQYCGDWCIRDWSVYCSNCGKRIKDDREEAEVKRCYTRYFCGECGDFVGVGDNYCENCGRKLNWKPLMEGERNENRC